MNAAGSTFERPRQSCRGSFSIRSAFDTETKSAFLGGRVGRTYDRYSSRRPLRASLPSTLLRDAPYHTDTTYPHYSGTIHQDFLHLFQSLDRQKTGISCGVFDDNALLRIITTVTQRMKVRNRLPCIAPREGHHFTSSASPRRFACGVVDSTFRPELSPEWMV